MVFAPTIVRPSPPDVGGSSNKGPLSSYQRYAIVPVFVAGFSGLCWGNVAVAIPTNVATDPNNTS